MGYHPMTDDERAAFLRHPVRPAIAATTRGDGRPHAVPVWYDFDDDVIVFTTHADTVKGRSLARDPRITLCVQDDQPPFSFVTVEGRAELVDDPALVRRWGTQIGGRYMGADRADEYGERNAVPGELLVRVRVEHTAAAKNLAD